MCLKSFSVDLPFFLSPASVDSLPSFHEDIFAKDQEQMHASREYIISRKQ